MKPYFAKPRIMAGAGVLPVQHRTSDISQKAPRLKLEPQLSRHISYDMPFSINAGGIVVRAALPPRRSAAAAQITTLREPRPLEGP